MEESSIKGMWSAFHNTGICDEALPRKIAASWIRSRKYGVDPYSQPESTYRYSEHDLNKARTANAWLISIVKPIMKEISMLFKDQRLVISLIDTNLRVIEVQHIKVLDFSSPEYESMKPGDCFLEKVVGTNAIDLCKTSGHVETVSGYEHYLENLNKRFCVAAPIYDEKENIIAIICAMGLNIKSLSNVDTVLTLTSKMITNIIKMSLVQKELIIKSRLHSAIVDATSDGMLTVDMNGIITFINPAGMRILHIDEPCIGKHITDAVDFKPTILDVIKNQKGYIDREFRLEGKRGTVHFIKTAIPLKDEFGEMIGVLDVFRSITQVKNMVNNMIGAQARYTVSHIIGKSESMQEVKKMIKIAGSNDGAVLIQGESGTGKEMIAQAIHTYGNRSEGPFIAINCAAIPRNLIESELFGYEDGSFTGAVKGGRPGKFEMANGGTLFLDEVGDMPLDIQSKLLRVLQQKAVVRIGGFKEIPFDVRIISATNKNLFDMMKEKNFREDLYYRLNLLNINTPPLREREEDIDIIAKHLLNQHNLVNGTIKVFADETMGCLNEWDWPGNIRELENAVEYSYCISEGDIIEPKHLPLKMSKTKSEIQKGNIISLKEAERRTIMAALQYANGRISIAAKILGIGRNTLYDKIRIYELNLDNIEKG